MNQTDFFELIHTMNQLNNHNIMQFTKAFRYPVGISPILVLAELHANGPQKQAELADTLGYTKGAMTSIAEKLVKQDLAIRLYDENDRRTIQLEITKDGAKALMEAQKVGEAVFGKLFEALNEEEIRQYLALQQKLIAGIEEQG